MMSGKILEKSITAHAATTTCLCVAPAISRARVDVMLASEMPCAPSAPPTRSSTVGPSIATQPPLRRTQAQACCADVCKYSLASESVHGGVYWVNDVKGVVTI